MGFVSRSFWVALWFVLLIVAPQGSRPGGTGKVDALGQTAPPPAPSLFSGIAISETSIYWSWNPVLGATHYEIHDSVSDTPIALVDASSGSFVEEGLLSGQECCRHIHASTNGSVSSSSNVACVTTVQVAPPHVCKKFDEFTVKVLENHIAFKPDGLNVGVVNNERSVTFKFPSEQSYDVERIGSEYLTVAHRILLRFFQLQDLPSTGTSHFLTFDKGWKTSFCGTLMAIAACPDPEKHEQSKKCDRVAYVQFVRDKEGRKPDGSTKWGPWKLDKQKAEGKEVKAGLKDTPEYRVTKDNDDYIMIDGPGAFSPKGFESSYMKDFQKELKTWVLCVEPEFAIVGYYSWGVKGISRVSSDGTKYCEATNTYPTGITGHDPLSEDYKSIYKDLLENKYPDYIPK